MAIVTTPIYFGILAAGIVFESSAGNVLMCTLCASVLAVRAYVRRRWGVARIVGTSHAPGGSALS